MNTETIHNGTPVALMPATPLPDSAAQMGGQRELPPDGKTQYWNSLLTGDLNTVPESVRLKAAGSVTGQTREERDYRIMSSINRSWVVDHRGLQRDQVRGQWPELRLGLSRELGVADSEPEVYTGLSLQNEDAPRRQKARELYTLHYTAALCGEPLEPPADEQQRRLCETASAQARLQREKLLPLAQALSEGWSALKAHETKLFSLPDIVAGTPGLIKAVDELAEMDPAMRSQVYAVARSLASTRELETEPEGLGGAMLHSVRRGVADIGHSLVQGVGHVGTALSRSLSESLHSDSLRDFSKAADKRLQALHELRQVAQGQVYPINLGEESSFAEELVVEAAGALPGAALAFMGGAGFGTLAVSGAGAAVAEARRRAPKGRQELQAAAGILGGALQAGIYMGMSRIGAKMLDRSIKEFVQAAKSGARGYSLAALKSLGTLTAENAKLLLAGKAAQAADLGSQELAARVDRVASNIDWEAFGDNFTDIEANMREAARNLPFVLIAAGRAALHHFRAPRALVEDSQMLREWGVDEATQKRIAENPDIHEQTLLLRDALCNSHRWSGTGNMVELLKSIRLLNSEYFNQFHNPKEARMFLNPAPDTSTTSRPAVPVRENVDPATAQKIYEKLVGKKKTLLNPRKSTPYVLLMEEYATKANLDKFSSPAERVQRGQLYLARIRDPRLVMSPKLSLNGYYLPDGAKLRKMVMTDIFSEMQDLLYEYTLGIETLDGLMRETKSVDGARKRLDENRRNAGSWICTAISDILSGKDRDTVIDEMYQKFSRYLYLRRTYAKHSPAWLRKMNAKHFENLKADASKSALRPTLKTPEEQRALYRNLVGLESCVDSLVYCLPRVEEYVEYLSAGLNPQQAGEIILRREMKDHYDTSVWSPPSLKADPPNNVDNVVRLKDSRIAFQNYLDLSGRSLEKSPDGKGGELLRIMKPDGQYTHWYHHENWVANALYGVMKMAFLRMGKDDLPALVHKGYQNHGGKNVYRFSSIIPTNNADFVGFDHLCSFATSELRSLWQGNSTLYGPGIEFSSSHENWLKTEGRSLGRMLKRIDDEADIYVFHHPKVHTPYTLCMQRFTAYWNRMLTSGWVSPEEAGELLVKARQMSPGSVADVISMGQDRTRELRHLTPESRRKIRRELRRNKQALIAPGDKVAMAHHLAENLAHVNFLVMLADLDKSGLPDSVRDWFLTAPFCNYKDIRDEGRVRGLLRMHSRKHAEKIKSLIPAVKKMRMLMQEEGGLPLMDKMLQAFQTPESRRYEQAWCFSVGGEGAFRGTGQHHWNLLEDPKRGWELMPESFRNRLMPELQEICGDRPVEESLYELADLLKQYPELRRYGVQSRGGEALCRISLDEVPTRDITDIQFTRAENTKLVRPMVVEKGYQMEQNVELPEDLAADARVLPAIRLLSELRRQTTASPYADDSGIWWNQKCYGGARGALPKGMDSGWIAEPALRTFTGLYNRLHQLAEADGKDGMLEVCGVPMGGFRPEDIDMSTLKNVTVYRNKRMPEAQVRLMPGELDAANPYQRVPYVVHTSDGIPLLPKRMSRDTHEFLQALTPLNQFSAPGERMYAYERNRYSRRKQMTGYLESLLNERTTSPEAWQRSNGSEINNLELFMQMFQDGRLPYFLESRDPRTLTRGEALASELGRLMLLSECGVEREAHVENLVRFCDRLREKPDDMQLIFDTLERISSPYPEKYQPHELTAPQMEESNDSNP